MEEKVIYKHKESVYQNAYFAIKENRIKQGYFCFFRLGNVFEIFVNKFIEIGVITVILAKCDADKGKVNQFESKIIKF